ncbi:MAG: sortase [Candidatus Dojkabacteria bacterium]|nr:MAG: sortase [Candidatus Dojkabacteria bacterium]
MTTPTEIFFRRVSIVLLAIAVSFVLHGELRMYQRVTIQELALPSGDEQRPHLVVMEIDQAVATSAPYPSSREQVFLEIPSVSIKGRVYFSHTERILDTGFWNYLGTNPWEDSGNTVIIGHRFAVLPPNPQTFYHLDQVKQGSEIILTDARGVLRYQVRSKQIVMVDDVSVLAQTEVPQITVITCHPLWTSRERLVIIADRKEVKYYEAPSHEEQ